MLVVDDNHDSADGLSLFLRMAGHEVHTAYSGSEALAIGAREQPDVVLLEIGMPGLSGYETAERVRAASSGQGAWLVAVTGWGQQSDKERAFAHGFD